MVLKPLNKGSKVGIVAPANYITKKSIDEAVTILKSWKLEVIYPTHLFKQYHQFGGTDQERTLDLQLMLDSTEVEAIFCAVGGYGTIRLIDHLDFTNFIKNPKWLVGYSDFTSLQNHVVRNFQIPCIHSSMPLKFKGSTEETFTTLKLGLFKNSLHYTIPSHPLNRHGETKGVLIGGNLTTLMSIAGSDSDFDPTDKILFIEERGELLYHIDRMMQTLKRSNKFSTLKGLIVGGFSDMRDNTIPFGKTPEEIVRAVVSKYDFPVCFGFPSGHIADNRALILGLEATLNCTSDKVELYF